MTNRQPSSSFPERPRVLEPSTRSQPFTLGQRKLTPNPLQTIAFQLHADPLVRLHLRQLCADAPLPQPNSALKIQKNHTPRTQD